MKEDRRGQEGGQYKEGEKDRIGWVKDQIGRWRGQGDKIEQAGLKIRQDG